MITNEDTMRLGFCLNHIAMVLDDENLAKAKPYLMEIEQIVLKYRKEGGTNATVQS